MGNVEMMIKSQLALWQTLKYLRGPCPPETGGGIIGGGGRGNLGIPIMGGKGRGPNPAMGGGGGGGKRDDPSGASPSSLEV